jgi:hypothetical protein
MAKISLTPYTVRVTKKSPDKQVKHVKLNSIAGKDLFVIIDEYFKKIQAVASINEDTSKVIKLKTTETKERTTCGILETGEFGYETEIFDTKTNIVTHSRKSHEAELIPFYYLLNFPINKDEGIIILQRFKQFGIRNILLDDFTKHFNQVFDDYHISINPLVAKEIVDRLFKEGKIMKIRFINFHLPKNIEEIYLQEGDHKESKSPGYIEHVVSLRRGRSFSSKLIAIVRKNVSELINTSTKVSELSELQEIYNCDNIKLDVEVGGTRRVVNLDRITKLRHNEDISNRVSITATGHPTFESINSIAAELLESISTSLYGETKNAE